MSQSPLLNRAPQAGSALQAQVSRAAVCACASLLQFVQPESNRLADPCVCLSRSLEGTSTCRRGRMPMRLVSLLQRCELLTIAGGMADLPHAPTLQHTC